MIAAKMSLSGANELQAWLKDLPARMQKKHLDFALKASAQPVLQAAKAYAPVDTGAVRNSLRIHEMKKKKRGVNAIRVATESGDFTGEQFYAAFLEYGFEKRPVIRLPDGRIRSLKRGVGKGIKVPGTRFMARAFNDNKHIAKQNFTKALRISIDAERKTLQQKARTAMEKQTRREMSALKKLARGNN